MGNPNGRHFKRESDIGQYKPNTLYLQTSVVSVLSTYNCCSLRSAPVLLIQFYDRIDCFSNQRTRSWELPFAIACVNRGFSFRVEFFVEP